MPEIAALFVTKLYRAELAAVREKRLVAELERSCRAIAEGDRAGQAWAKANGYPGYTSYASLNDLPQRDPVFEELQSCLAAHVAEFAKSVDFDLGGRKLALDSIWVNVLNPGGHHTAHIHPHSVVSGTLYVSVPKGASAIKFEDPRHAQMMAAPPRKAKAREENRTYISVEPKVGTLLLWESFVRHEVPVNQAKSERISISFNYRWD